MAAIHRRPVLSARFTADFGGHRDRHLAAQRDAAHTAPSLPWGGPFRSFRERIAGGGQRPGSETTRSDILSGYVSLTKPRIIED